jgi:hypothetical protein
MGEEHKKHQFTIIRIFLAAIFASLLNTFIGGNIINNIALPKILSEALLIGFLVLLFDFILKEIGI